MLYYVCMIQDMTLPSTRESRDINDRIAATQSELMHGIGAWGAAVDKTAAFESFTTIVDQPVVDAETGGTRIASEVRVRFWIGDEEHEWVQNIPAVVYITSYGD